MRGWIPIVFVGLACVNSVAEAQDGPLRRLGRGLDNTGKNIRARVENEVARGRTISVERDLAGRVFNRVQWDKQLVGSAFQIEARADGLIVLRGSVVSDQARARLLDLVENTVGVTTVEDRTVIATEKPAARVIETRPAAPSTHVIDSTPGVFAEEPVGQTRVVVPADANPAPEPVVTPTVPGEPARP